MSFNKYPYTDFHEMNDDWVIAKVKELIAAWAEVKADWTQIQSDWTDEQQAFQDLKDFVNTYFDDLDVQEEINTKLDDMAADGTLAPLIAPYVPDAVSAWLSANIDPDTGYVIDKTFLVSDAAADAKITGERFQPSEYVIRLESGSFASDRVTKAPNVKRIINVFPIPINMLYELALPSGYDMYVFFLDKTFTSISASSVRTAIKKSAAPANCEYINILIKYTADPDADISGDVATVESGLVITWAHDTDTGLNTANRPADSKAVGDAINAIKYAPSISGGSDLNDYIIPGSFFISNATTVSNAPVATGRRFLHVTAPANGVIAHQELINANDGAIYSRYYLLSSDTWSAWVLQNPTTQAKLIYGSNPYRKASDHGGFWNRPSEAYMEDAPIAFERAAAEGIMYHNVDIICSQDGVPFSAHNNTVTEVDGTTHTISNATAETIKTWNIGTSDYSFTLQTLAEVNEAVKKMGGIVDTVDVSYMTDAQAALLKTYYNANGIRPTWTNFDDPDQRTVFINSSGGDFAVYIACTDTTDIEAALTYIAAHSGTKFAVNLYASSSGMGIDVAGAYVGQLRALDVTIYVYIYNTLTDNPIPGWADGVMSETMNVNYIEANS